MTFIPLNFSSKTFACAAALALSATLPALAQTAAQPLAVTPDDRSFLTSMLQESRAQLAMAQLADSRITDTTVVSLARKMTHDWTWISEQLRPLAVTAGVSVPAALDPAQQRTLDQLTRTPAAQFDAAYLRVAQSGANMALDRIEDEMENSDNPGLRSFVDAALPIAENDQSLVAGTVQTIKAG